MYDFLDTYDIPPEVLQTLTAFWTGYIIFALALGVFLIIARWKMFQKAGEEGWAAIVPYYSSYVFFKITWGNGWLFLLDLLAIIPIFGQIAVLVINIITYVKLANAFGKGGGFACGLIFLTPIFMMILGFSKDIRYVGVNGVAPEQPGSDFQSAAAPQVPEYRQYQQESAANDQYHYQRNEPQGGEGGNYCPACGEKLEPGTKFCPKCGRAINN